MDPSTKIARTRADVPWEELEQRFVEDDGCSVADLHRWATSKGYAVSVHALYRRADKDDWFAKRSERIAGDLDHARKTARTLIHGIAAKQLIHRLRTLEATNDRVLRRLQKACAPGATPVRARDVVTQEGTTNVTDPTTGKVIKQPYSRTTTSVLPAPDSGNALALLRIESELLARLLGLGKDPNADGTPKGSVFNIAEG